MTPPVLYKDSLISNRLTLGLGGSYDFDLTKLYLSYQYAKHAKSVGALTGKNILSMYKESNFNETARKADPLSAGALDIAVTQRVASMIDNANGLDAHSVAVGADTPLGNGVLKAQVGYMQGKTHTPYSGAHLKGVTFKVKAIGAALGYEYNLSKSTQLYTGIGFNRSKFDISGTYGRLATNAIKGQIKQTNYEGMFGLVHKF